MNACAILVLPHSFNVQTLSTKTPTRVFVWLGRKIFGDDKFVNGATAGFLLGVAEERGEFRIDLQDAVTDVEQDDRFWHSGKKSVEQGLVANSFRDGARVDPFWGKLVRRTHTAHPPNRPVFGKCIQVQI